MEMPSIFLNKILSEVASQKAAGVHLAVGSAPMLRQGDRLFPVEGEDILTEDKINKLLEDFLSQEELERLKSEKELVLVKNFFDKFRFRVNIFYQEIRFSPCFETNYIARLNVHLVSINGICVAVNYMITLTESIQTNT